MPRREKQKGDHQGRGGVGSAAVATKDPGEKKRAGTGTQDKQKTIRGTTHRERGETRGGRPRQRWFFFGQTEKQGQTGRSQPGSQLGKGRGVVIRIAPGGARILEQANKKKKGGKKRWGDGPKIQEISILKAKR